MKRLSWFVCFSIFAVSCLDQPDCYQLNNNVAAFGFKIIGGGNDQIYLQTVYADDLTTSLIASAGNVSSIQLPLNPYSNEITYTLNGYFQPLDPFVGADTRKLDLTYKALVQFVSEDCGERHVFNDMGVIASDFDSVRILNSVPTNPPSVNFDIFRCPRTDIIYVDFINDLNINNIQLSASRVIDVGKSISDVYLPVSLSDTTSNFVFNFADGTAGNLTVNYDTATRTVSSRCGRQMFVNHISYDAKLTNFSKVTIVTDSIYDLPTKVNLEITR